MKYLINRFLLLMILCFAGIGCKLFDSGTEITVKDTGGVEGVVTDRTNGNVLSDALVQIGDKSNKTNSNGAYSLKDLTVGDHIISVFRKGYEIYFDTVQIIKNSVISKDIKLNPLPPGSNNNAPVAIIVTPDQTVAAGSEVILDASQSYDPDGDIYILDYRWSFLSAPSENLSQIIPSNSNTPLSKFIPDIGGTYVINLLVTDGFAASSDTVTITVTPKPPPPPTKPVVYYPFNGNANDESGNGNHAAVFGATSTTDRFGNPNSAYSFDGVNDYIGIPASATSGITGNIDYTLKLWIKTTESRANPDPYGSQFPYPERYWQNPTIMGQLVKGRLEKVEGSQDFVIYTGNGYLGMGSGLWYGVIQSGVGSTGNRKISDNLWHCIVVKHEASGFRKIYTYVDGILEGSREYFGVFSSPVQFYIGALNNIKQGSVPESFHSGVFDDIAIYNLALSEDEIKRLSQ